MFCNHLTIIPTIKAILDSPDLQLDGFLGLGHVSMVIGTMPYTFIADYYRKPITIAGFEPLDILQSVWMVLKQLAEGRCEVENQYTRIVHQNGNTPALQAIQKVFELRDFFEWRGLASIDHSGIRVREELSAFDAERKFPVLNLKIADPTSGCNTLTIPGRLSINHQTPAHIIRRWRTSNCTKQKSSCFLSTGLPTIP